MIIQILKSRSRNSDTRTPIILLSSAEYASSTKRQGGDDHTIMLTSLVYDEDEIKLLICKHFDNFIGSYHYYCFITSVSKHRRLKKQEYIMFTSWKALLCKFKFICICRINQVSLTKFNEVRFDLRLFWVFLLLFCLLC